MAARGAAQVLRERIGIEATDALSTMMNESTRSMAEEIVRALDDRFERRLTEGLARVNRRLTEEISGLRIEIHKGFGDLRAEMHGGFGEVRAEIANGKKKDPMILRAYRKLNDSLVAQCSTPAGHRRVWIILFIVTIVGDFLLYGLLVPSLK
jgi:hypothetical protein